MQDAGTTHFFSRYTESADFDDYLADLQSGDAFVQAVARQALSENQGFHDELITLTVDEDAELRLQALLTLSQSETPLRQNRLTELLHDQDEKVRRMAMIHIATHARSELLPEVESALYEGYISPALFETYLATVRHLQPGYIQAMQERTEAEAKNIKRELPDRYLMQIITNEKLKAEIRAAALPYLEAQEGDREQLAAMLDESAPVLQMALLHALEQTYDEALAESMLQIALDDNKQPELRAQALVALAYQPTKFCEQVQAIFRENNELLQETALRYLCTCGAENEVVQQLITESQHSSSGQLEQLWQHCRGTLPKEARPSSDEEWLAAVNEAGDPLKGRMVFQLPNTQCTRCHQVDGWGSDFGPDLSNVGISKSEEQLVESILEPSAAISPEWQGWYVKDEKGQTHYGRQIDVGYNSAELLMPSGAFVRYQNPQGYGVAPSSLMPDGLENMMTAQEFNHLIAYLKSLR
jgi:putative heme-binding domain-containing protein